MNYGLRHPTSEPRRVEGSWQIALRECRKAAGLSAKAVCAAIGAHGAVNHGGVLSNWETGLAWPTWEQWEALKAVLPIGDDFDDEIRRGAPRPPRKRAERGPSVGTRWFQWPRGEHSAKPDAFLDVVEQVSPGPYAELFARRARFGWDYPIGDQALGGVAA